MPPKTKRKNAIGARERRALGIPSPVAAPVPVEIDVVADAAEPNLSESMVMVTPETPKQRGIISRKNKNWVLTPSQTPPESPNIFYRHLDKPSYRDQFIANTPPRTRKGGKRGKNIRKNKTMRKYSKK